MKEKWKSLTALCLAAFLGFVIPVSAVYATESEPVSEIQTKLICTAADTGGAPVVEIKYQGQNLTTSMGGTVEYNLYINNCDQRLSISTGQGSSLTSLSYYLDSTGGAAAGKTEEQLSSLWRSAELISYQEVPIAQDGQYVLYVKAEAVNGQTTCVRTVGMVVDSVPPVITGIQNGGTYPAGTKFGVEDDNLDTVLVNEQAALPSGEDGMYQVAANGTSCVIRAKDKAGHETIYSITVSGEGGNPGGDNPGGDNPPDDTTVINKSGSYSLKAGTAYRLGGGSWKLEGDSVVYSGGITFYVNKDGDYKFTIAD